MLILDFWFRDRISAKVCVNNQINHGRYTGISSDCNHMKFKYNGETNYLWKSTHFQCEIYLRFWTKWRQKKQRLFFQKLIIVHFNQASLNLSSEINISCPSQWNLFLTIFWLLIDRNSTPENACFRQKKEKKIKSRYILKKQVQCSNGLPVLRLISQTSQK